MRTLQQPSPKKINAIYNFTGRTDCFNSPAFFSAYSPMGLYYVRFMAEYSLNINVLYG